MVSEQHKSSQLSDVPKTLNLYCVKRGLVLTKH